MEENSRLPTSYKTIASGAETTFKDKGSRFIGYAFPMISAEDFKIKLKELKAEHPKAVHHCFAYRLGTDGNAFRASDDGEPSGTAGKPILGQIDSKGVTDCGIIVVRYFGGTLLGVPGLINAYKTTASLLLQLTPVVEKLITSSITLQSSYETIQVVMSLVEKYKAIIANKDIGLFCVFTIHVPRHSLEALQREVRNTNDMEEIILLEKSKKKRSK